MGTNNTDKVVNEIMSRANWLNATAESEIWRIADSVMKERAIVTKDRSLVQEALQERLSSKQKEQ